MSNNALVHIDAVINEAQSDLGEFQQHYYAILYGYAVRCIEEMNYDILNWPHERYFPVDHTTKTVTLPDGFVNHITVGVEHNGIVWALGLNPRMCRPMKDDCGDVVLGDGGLPSGMKRQWRTLNQGDTSDNAFWWDWWEYGYDYWRGQKLYGEGGGWNERGYYRVMKEDGIILLNPDFKWDNIVLTWVGDRYSPGTKTMVPKMVANAMISYMKWKHFQGKANISTGILFRENTAKAKGFEDEYWAARQVAKARRVNNSLYEIVAAYRRSYGPHIKM